jgi:hypothetical protein
MRYRMAKFTPSFILFIIIVVSIRFLFQEPIDKAYEIDNKCTHTDTEFNCVEFLYNYDGDTAKFHIPFTIPILNKMAVRLPDVDTGELNSKDDCEKALAIHAKEHVFNILSNAKEISIVEIEELDTFGRIVGEIVADGKYISSSLLGNYLATHEKSGNADWCKLLSDYVGEAK